VSHSHKNLIVVVGPTAVGKTDVAIRIALRFQSEIISADSRQLYNEMNIGTAKPSTKQLAQVPHHFINTHSIHETFNASRFGDEALVKMELLFQRHDTLVLCGGSGLYVKAVCDGFDAIPEIPPEIRHELNEQYQNQGLTWLQEKMKQLDPGYFSMIDQQNPQRLIRALEVVIGTGMSIRDFQTRKNTVRPFNSIKVGLNIERGELYRRIDDRMDRMIEEGLFEEARELYPFKDLNALQTVGYQEIFGYFEGRYDRGEAIRLLKQNSRRYAKRQLTWFQKDKEIKWFDPSDVEKIFDWLEEQVQINNI
jgi:tRNA dimethylallyltransferase